MVSIRNLGKLVSSFINTERTTLAHNDKAVYDFLSLMTSGYTKGHRENDLPRIYFEGANYDKLPSLVKGFADSLKLRRPNVIVRGRSLKQGQGIIGFKICDGDKVVGTTAYGLDLTRGEQPIQQLRVSIVNGSERAIGFNAIFDTNLQGKSALKCDTFVDRRLAKQMKLSDDILKGIPTSSNVSKKGLSDSSQYLRELFANEGIMIHSVTECTDELAQIAEKTGEVTEQSATEAVEMILSKMGYNPKDVKLNLNNLESGNPGSFDQITGELNFDLSQIGTHQDLADFIIHEFTHMEDYILLYKKIGAKRFEKSVGSGFNRDFYDNMSKYVNKNQKFALNGATTTNRTEKFGVRQMEKETRRDIISCREFDNSVYCNCRDNYEYIKSNIEGHAREAEWLLRSRLEHAGTFKKTALSEHYGRAPGYSPMDYTEMFEQIDKALSKYGDKKAQKFNELFEQSLYIENAEIAALYKQIKNFSAGKAPEELLNKYDEMVNKYFGSAETFQLYTMEVMQTKLGLKADSGLLSTIQTLQLNWPELGDIKQEMLKCTSQKEFAQLVKKQDEVLKKLEDSINKFRGCNVDHVKRVRDKIAKSDLNPETKQQLVDRYNIIIDKLEHGDIQSVVELTDNLGLSR